MRAVMVMYDTLSRGFLPPYGNDWVVAPSFERLAERGVTFDNCYAGSMPCIPARRELHTGRVNFLHRSWGPIEPFDDSMPELLDEAGVHAHLVTDHKHYWDDGGATYHPRYTTFELVRGQQGDRWVGDVAALRGGDDPPASGPAAARAHRQRVRRQDAANRRAMPTPAEHSQTRVFDGGLEFIRRNHAEDRWFLQIETFDPHEPFFAHDEFLDLYPGLDGRTGSDWPPYAPVGDEPEAVEAVRRRYAALVSMCDRSLGRVLDAFDEHGLWDDTMLVVWTDHGFLLGEHGWYGKSRMPWYEETIHTPLFVWDPASGVRGERRSALVQTIDLAPTLLDHFGVERPPDMQGVSLRDTIASDGRVRESALFGMFGGSVSVTDGRHVYMRGTPDPANRPLNEYTLLPLRVGSRFHGDLRELELVPPFSFTKGAPVLRVPVDAGRVWPMNGANAYVFGTCLFDLDADPGQERPLVDDGVELRLCELLVGWLRASDAPVEQFERLGLPAEGPVEERHLLARSQHALATATPEALAALAADIETRAAAAS